MIARASRRRRRGVTMIIAVTLLALTSAAAVAVTGLVLTDLKRTQRELDESQLRQLLLAGAAHVAARLQQPGDAPKEWPIKLPDELTTRGASLKVTAAGSGVFSVRAQCAGQIREQRLTYKHEAAGNWRLVSSDLSR